MLWLFLAKSRNYWVFTRDGGNSNSNIFSEFSSRFFLVKFAPILTTCAYFSHGLVQLNHQPEQFLPCQKWFNFSGIWELFVRYFEDKSDQKQLLNGCTYYGNETWRWTLIILVLLLSLEDISSPTRPNDRNSHFEDLPLLGHWFHHRPRGGH